MVAKIESGKSIRGILHYNEDKVASLDARLIMASGFAADIKKMNFSQKLNRFKHLTGLNAAVKTNALHISLNFDASDKLDNQKLQQIALEYMKRIGFGDQPFLVYRHADSAHPHIHIVTTNIQKDGERIDIHGIGYRFIRAST
ncbi:relaxase/mobilization nuclease domain-containing protein [Pedobacter sp. PF22-3]|uniref:relaxase/mobilization nuclease domain-containing protein n=1 Tax=Pedobacter sp. PF22-3 TaxID=2994467 RepID=UPI002246F934|nr:relaxase/mobilization nuclease domain-containing protein [Pedobacter sp. PF22-3]MCX2492626.1 relaxase/mobilization nuclease domain-containing protein [Pedobacter sp. PF22-3]